MLTIFPRYALRRWRDRRDASAPLATRYLIFGAGEGGAIAVRMMLRNGGGNSVPVALVMLQAEVDRQGAEQALESLFGLKKVDWIATAEHESILPFESHIARPDVAVVLLAIRWSSHAYGDVKRFCDKHGKPLVRLPAGYSPNQVAIQVLAQCGDRLRTG